MKNHPNPHHDDAKIVAALQKRGWTVKPGDYSHWLEPENQAAYNRLDMAAKLILGRENYTLADQAARLDVALRKALKIK